MLHPTAPREASTFLGAPFKQKEQQFNTRHRLCDRENINGCTACFACNKPTFKHCTRTDQTWTAGAICTGSTVSPLGSWDQVLDPFSSDEDRQRARQPARPTSRSRSRSKGSGSSNGSSSILSRSGRGHGCSNVRVETIMRLRPQLLRTKGSSTGNDSGHSTSQLLQDGTLPDVMILSRRGSSSNKQGRAVTPVDHAHARGLLFSESADATKSHDLQDNKPAAHHPASTATVVALPAPAEAAAGTATAAAAAFDCSLTHPSQILPSALAPQAAAPLFVPVNSECLRSSEDACRALVQLASWVAPMPDHNNSSSRDYAWVGSSSRPSCENSSNSYLPASHPSIIASRDAILVHSLSLSFLPTQSNSVSSAATDSAFHPVHASLAKGNGTDSKRLSLRSSNSNTSSTPVPSPVSSPSSAVLEGTFSPAAATLTLWALGVLAPASSPFTPLPSGIAPPGSVTNVTHSMQTQLAAAARLLMHHSVDALDHHGSSGMACSAAELSRAVWGVAQCLGQGAVAQPTADADSVKAGHVSSSSTQKVRGSSGCSIKDRQISRSTRVSSSSGSAQVLDDPGKHRPANTSPGGDGTEQPPAAYSSSSVTSSSSSSSRLTPSSARSRDREGSRGRPMLADPVSTPPSPHHTPNLPTPHTTPPSSEPRSRDEWVTWLSDTYNSSANILNSTCSCVRLSLSSSYSSSPGCSCGYAVACSCDCSHRPQHLADMLASAAQLGFKPPHPWVSSLWLALDRIMLPPVLQQQVKLQPHQIMDPLQQLHPAVQHTTLTQILTSIADLGLQLRPPPTSKPPAATATKSPTTKASNPPNTSATRPQPKAGTKPQSLTVTQWHTAPASKLPTAATKTQTAAATPQTAAALQTLITAAVSISILPTSASPLPPSTLLPKLWVLSQHLLPTCSPETLASTLAALARLRLQLSGSWMAAWTARSLETMQEASPKQLQSCLVSFAELKLAPARLWADAAMAQILPPQEQQSSCVLQDTDCLCGCSGGEPCSRPTSSRSGSTEMMPSGDVSMGSSRDWSSLSAADWASLLQALASLDVRVELQWLWRVAGLLTPQVQSMSVDELSTTLNSIAHLHKSRSVSSSSSGDTQSSAVKTLPPFLAASASASLPMLRSSSKEHALRIGWSLCMLAKPAAAASAAADAIKPDCGLHLSVQAQQPQVFTGSVPAQQLVSGSDTLACLPGNEWRARYYQVMQQLCSSFRGAEVVTALESVAMLQPAWEERSPQVQDKSSSQPAPLEVQTPAGTRARRLLFSSTSQTRAIPSGEGSQPRQHAPGPLPPPLLLHSRLLEHVLLPEAVCSGEHVAAALHHAATQLHSGVPARWLQAALTALHAVRSITSGSALAHGVLASATVAEPRRAAPPLRPARPLLGAIARQCGRRSVSLPAEQLASLATSLISLDVIHHSSLIAAARKRQHRRHLARLSRGSITHSGAPAMHRWRHQLPIRIVSVSNSPPQPTPSPLVLPALESQPPTPAESTATKAAPVVASLWPLLPSATPQSLLTQKPVRVRPYLPQRFRFLPVDYVTAYSSSTILRQAAAASAAATTSSVSVLTHAHNSVHSLAAAQVETGPGEHDISGSDSGIFGPPADIHQGVTTRDSRTSSSSGAERNHTSHSLLSIRSSSSIRTLETINNLAIISRKAGPSFFKPKRSTGLLQQWMKELQSDIDSGSGSIQSLCAIAQALVMTGITTPSSATPSTTQRSLGTAFPSAWQPSITSILAPQTASVSMSSIFLRGIAPLAAHTPTSPRSRTVPSRHFHRKPVSRRPYAGTSTFSLALRPPPPSLLHPPSNWRATLLRASLPKLAHMASSAIGMSWLLQSVACPSLPQLEPTWLPTWHNHTWARLHRLPASHLSALLQLHLSHSWVPPLQWMESAARAIASLACPALSTPSANPLAAALLSRSGSGIASSSARNSNAGVEASGGVGAVAGKVGAQQEFEPALFPVVVSLTRDLYALGLPHNEHLLSAVGSSFSLSLVGASALQTLQILHSLQTLQPQPQVYSAAVLASETQTSAEARHSDVQDSRQRDVATATGESVASPPLQSSPWIPELMSALHMHITARAPTRFVRQLQQEQGVENATHEDAVAAFEHQRALRQASAHNEVGRDGYRRSDISVVSSRRFSTNSRGEWRHSFSGSSSSTTDDLSQGSNTRRAAASPTCPDHSQLLPCLLASFVRWGHSPPTPWVAEVLRHAAGLTHDDLPSRANTIFDSSSSDRSPPAFSGSQLVSMMYSAAQLDHSPALDATAGLLDAVYERMADTPPSHLVILVSCLSKMQRRPADAWWERLEEVLDPGHNPDMLASSAFPSMSVDDIDDWSGVAALSVKELAQVLSAMVALGRAPKASWLSGVLILVGRGLAEADGAVVASIMRSLAALQEYPGKPYMERLLSVSQAYLECSDAGELADLIHAVSTLKHKPRGEWVFAFLARLNEVFADCWPSQLHTTLVALATLDIRPPPALLDAILPSLLTPHILQSTGAPQALELAWAVERLIGSSSGPFVLPSMQDIIGGSGGANAALLSALKAGALVAGVNKPSSVSLHRGSATVRVVGGRRGGVAASSPGGATKRLFAVSAPSAQPRYVSKSSAKQSMLMAKLLGGDVEDKEADEVRLPLLDASHVGSKLAGAVAAELRRHCSRSIIGPLVTTERRPLRRGLGARRDNGDGGVAEHEFEEQVVPLLAARMRRPLQPLPHMQQGAPRRMGGPRNGGDQGGAYARSEQDESSRGSFAPRRSRLSASQPRETASSARW